MECQWAIHCSRVMTMGQWHEREEECVTPVGPQYKGKITAKDELFLLFSYSVVCVLNFAFPKGL